MLTSLEQLDASLEAALVGYDFGPVILLLVTIALLDLALKGWGMWRAARMRKKGWFIAILIFNTMGILPIVFLLMTKKEYRRQLDPKT